jgi:DNA (cytosine-5)-methyltransferase 1
MNYLSVCSGIEAATVAWHHMGWNPVGFSEIEKFPSQVLAHHYPQVINFGDMTKYKEWKIDSVGLLVGGTPCQSFSVAGLRKGLSDPRGNLALTYVGILDHFRPKWFIWENVPGVLSSNQGRDFAAFLTSLGIIGYGWSYRVLDAQYFGVAQRRRRVFVVGCLGDWRPTAEVLFESDCLRRDTKKGREKREETASSSIPSIASCLQTTCNDYSRADGFNMIAYENHPSDSRVKEMGDVCQTVTSSWGTGGGNIPFVQSFGWQNSASQSMSVDSITPTLDKSKTPAILQNVISWDAELNPNINKMGTLIRGGQGGRTEGVAIPYDLYQITSPLNGQRRQNGDPCHTLARDNAAHASITNGMAVRRLTPIECERLQGFPDGYTDIKPKGKDTPDGHRYKALGNSMAVPVMRWIGERINSYEAMCSKAVM